MTDQSPQQTPDLPGLELPEQAGVFLSAIHGDPEMGKYTGELLKSSKPELYQACIQLLGRNYSIRSVAQILKISPRSVMGIRDREPDEIATVKQYVAKRFLDISQLSAEVALDRLVDDPDSISFKDLMIGGAVATDKHLVLSGEATSRVEHVVRQDDEDFERMLKDAKAAGKVIDVEDAQDMDSSAKPFQQKGAAPAGPRPAPLLIGPVADPVPENVVSDIESPVIEDNTNV